MNKDEPGEVNRVVCARRGTKTIAELNVIRTSARILTFRASREEFSALRATNLLFGLACTWIVGMGRYWDDPGARILQHLGVGSLAYIFILSFLLWLVIWPLRPKAWSYFNVLTFVSLTSPPAILYAIPVERFFSLHTARALNAWFLGIVATWRVALLVRYLNRHAQLGMFSIAVATLLPLTLIVTTLTALNLERAAFDIMSGIREPGTANDTAYAILFLLTYSSVMLFIPLLMLYVGLVVNAFLEARKKRMRNEISA